MRKNLDRPLSTAVSLATLVGVVGLLAVGCAAGSSAASSAEGPGTRVISDIIACSKETDCDTAAGLTCGQGFCQMKRCSSKTYASLPPLGQSGYAYTDRSFVIGSPASTLEVEGAHTKAGTTVKVTAEPTDVAGGNLTGARPESLAYITAGGNSLNVVGVDGSNAKSIDVGFIGTRVATGDVDGDGIDEIVVAGASQYALCSAVKGSCTRATLSGAVTDVAIGDVDGDGLGELLFFGNRTLTIINVDSGKIDTQPIAADLLSITAGDLDGDGTAEVIGTEQGSYFTSDAVHVYKYAGAGGISRLADLTLPSNVNNRTLDVQFTKQDDQPVFAVLADGSTLMTFGLQGNTLSQTGTTAIASQAGHRLAVADIAGRSAAVTLTGPATIEVGPVVPLAVLTFPPYSATHSSGPSSVSLGDSKGTSASTTGSTSTSNSVSLMLSGSVSAAGLGVHRYASKSYSVSQSRSVSTATSQSVGGSYSITAEPQTDGYDSGAVVLAGGCFHKYAYKVDDPQNVLADTTKDLTIFVPVGGETSVWTTARYNALSDAMADGRLPKVAITPSIGNVASYPKTPTTLDGKPIPDDDNVFKDTPVFRTSENATVSFNMSDGGSTTLSTSATFSYGDSNGISASGQLGIVSLQAQYSNDTSWSLDTSYSVTVDSSTSFSGSVAPIRDDPSTPANESTLYAYSFRPYVYRHHFKDTKGTKGAFYALTYTVSQ